MDEEFNFEDWDRRSVHNNKIMVIIAALISVAFVLGIMGASMVTGAIK